LPLGSGSVVLRIFADTDPGSRIFADPDPGSGSVVPRIFAVLVPGSGSVVPRIFPDTDPGSRIFSDPDQNNNKDADFENHFSAVKICVKRAKSFLTVFWIRIF